MPIKEKDPLGKALKEFLQTGKEESVIIHSDISEDDIIPVSYLFRNYDNMPEIEKVALNLCKGKVLDIGAGAGPHSLWLQKEGLFVTAIDKSEGAVEVMKDLGIINPILNDVKKITEKYNTILLLMNGIGIAGKINNLKSFLKHLKSLLYDGGEILLESTDLSYMYQEEDGSVWIDIEKAYWGEVKYQMEYKKLRGKPFFWLFVDFKKLSEEAAAVGLSTELIFEGKNHEYLARLVCL